MGGFQRITKITDTISLDALSNAIPDYAKDIRVNLGATINDTLLNEQQKWGAMVAAAHACGCWALCLAIDSEAHKHITPEACAAAKSAAAITAMNNVYHRSLHLMRNQDYATLRTGLRMTAVANPGVDKGDFEFWCFVASAINGCGTCLDAHEEELLKRNWPVTRVQAGLKIAAIFAAVAAVVRAEAG